jgi:hypothetical protein
MKPLSFGRKRKIGINRLEKEEERVGLLGIDCNRVFA